MCLWVNRRCMSSMNVQFQGVNEDKGHVVNACFLGPPCRAICLSPHAEVQLCPEGLARADALDLFFHCKDRDSCEAVCVKMT